MIGQSDSGTAVVGESAGDVGVYGSSSMSKVGSGVWGHSDDGYGAVGQSPHGYGVVGASYSRVGVRGDSYKDYGLYAVGYSGLAPYLEGDVTITGTLYKYGLAFKIDHLLDPANKYLYHSSVESPEMKNVYDGVAVLDNKGETEIELPDWFSALNKDFRYQLTAIGAPGPNLYIAEEISAANTNYSKTSSSNKNSFKIAGGKAGIKVSWQVTGIRKDPWANAHRIQVEEDKPDKERAYYISRSLWSVCRDWNKPTALSRAK